MEEENITNNNRNVFLFIDGLEKVNTTNLRINSVHEDDGTTSLAVYHKIDDDDDDEDDDLNSFVPFWDFEDHVQPTIAIVILKSLQTNNTLKELYLDDVELGDGPETVEAFQSLQINQTLENLCIANTNLGPESGIAIGKSLQTNQTLKNLKMFMNNIGSNGVVAIGNSLQTNQTLLHLNLGNNNLGPEGGIAIGNSLQTNQTLEDLHMFENHLGPESGVAIGNSLRTNQTLLYLNLCINNLGPESGIAIGKSLQTNQTLLHLDLGHNNIGPEGGIAIGKSLQTNQTLKNLDLGHNNIGPEGGIAIGQSLQTNNSLQELYLGNNNLGNEGAVGVIRGSAVNNQNTRITTLYLCHNNITRLHAELTQCPPTLTEFGYYGNPIEFVPPNVQRWLGRYQGQQNGQIHKDRQNVHNRQIQQSIKESINKIVNATDGPKSLDEVRTIILNDHILSGQCKTQLLQYAMDESVHTDLQLTFGDLLCYIFTRIDVNTANGDEIKRILNQEMTDALCMCFTGRLSRLLNCLTGIDPLVHIHIVNLNDMFRNVGERLINEDKYTTKAHQVQFEKELQEDYGYELTEQFRKELDEKFYCAIEDFYETVVESISVNGKRKATYNCEEPERKKEKIDKDEKNTKKK